MTELQHGSAPPQRMCLRRTAWALGCPGLLMAVALFSATAFGAGPFVAAGATPAGRANPFQATTSLAARQDAIRCIPLARMDAQAKAKVNAVLSNVTVFRRLPVRVIDCDPDLYLFLVRHPDVVVNIWETLKLSQLQVRQAAPEMFRVVDGDGTTATFEYLYRSHDTHVVYAEGAYTGAVLARPVKGRGLIILKTGYVRETDGRSYITNRMDVFVNVEPGAAELVARTLHPLVGRIVDNNFSQSVGFVGSLSRTSEVNSRGVQRLAEKLTHVQPEVRRQLAELAGGVAERTEPHAPRPAKDQPLMASHEEAEAKDKR